jgi:hypothetical protein
MSKENMHFRLKLEIDELVNEMINKLPDTLFISKYATFLDPSIGGGQYVRAIEQRLREFGHNDDNIKNRVFGIEKSTWKINFAVNKHKLVGTYKVDTKDVPDIFMNMKFDCIVGNPPYQKKVGNRKTEPLWHIFVQNSIESLKPSGIMCLVHPSGWRNVDGKYKNTRNLITSKDVQYLEIHNEKDGLETFGAETRYDWYVLKNEPTKNKTIVKFQDGEIKTIDLANCKFIPNGSYEKIQSLLAKNGETSCKVMYDRTEYGTDKENMSKTESSVDVLWNCDYHTQKMDIMSHKKSVKFKYPVVYTVAKGDKINLWYSSEKKGHFGVPKLIWSNGRIISIGCIIDKDGKYGLSQFAYGLVESPENLESIKKVFDSDEFRKIMEHCSVGELSLNRKVLELFKKDFWKEFL